NPGSGRESASCTSQQSVSNANCAPKCSSACAGFAAAASVTGFPMVSSVVAGPSCAATRPCRMGGHDDPRPHSPHAHPPAPARAGLAAMTISDQIPPMRNRKVAVLLYDGLCMFEFACAAEVFGLERPEAGPGWYSFRTASVDGRPVRTQYGGRMQPDGDLKLLQAAGTIIVPGWRGAEATVPDALVAALRSAHRR